MPEQAFLCALLLDTCRLRVCCFNAVCPDVCGLKCLNARGQAFHYTPLHCCSCICHCPGFLHTSLAPLSRAAGSHHASGQNRCPKCDCLMRLLKRCNNTQSCNRKVMIQQKRAAGRAPGSKHKKHMCPGTGKTRSHHISVAQGKRASKWDEFQAKNNFAHHGRAAHAAALLWGGDKPQANKEPWNNGWTKE